MACVAEGDLGKEQPEGLAPDEITVDISDEESFRLS
jgi:hypothetical protein